MTGFDCTRQTKKHAAGLEEGNILTAAVVVWNITPQNR